MEKKIITISREFGSGGRTVGRLVADKLGIPFLFMSRQYPLKFILKVIFLND